ncbi:MAG: GDSL-type esterase/lipase family protein [Oscillospiraceae bacterium]
MKQKRSISLLLCLCLAVSLLLSGCGKKEQLLALGDSITLGVSLEKPEKECYPTLMAKDKNLSVKNAAVSGAKSAETKALITGGAMDEDLASAEYITLTLGGNDLSAVLYGSVGARLSEEEGTTVDWKQVKERLLAGDFATISALDKVIKALTGEEDSPEKAALATSLESFKANLSDIANYIKTKNPEAKLVVFTYFNPFAWITLEQIKPAVQGMDMCIQEVNAVIKDGAATNGYIVADAYTEFSKSKESLSTAYANSLFDMNLDIHANAEGHKLMAKLAEAALFPEG